MTGPSDSRRPTEAELNAFLDGELGPEAQAAVERYLAADAEDARRIGDYRAIGDGLHQLFDPVLGEPVPARLVAAAERQRPLPLVWAMRIAAALLLMVAGAAAGWLLRPLLPGGYDQPSLVAHAIDAHRMFSVENRHAVEVDASDEAHLSAWLSQRLGKPIKPPPLAGAGFQLVGGRLLPADGKPAAQFMYENAAKQRLTLFFMAAATTDASYRYYQDGGTTALFWYIDGFACALTGEFEQKELMAFAREIYRARGGDASTYTW
jgi:anti-sigma factor RsiW